MAGEVEAGGGQVAGGVEAGGGQVAGEVETGGGQVAVEVEAGGGKVAGEVEAGGGQVAGEAVHWRDVPSLQFERFQWFCPIFDNLLSCSHSRSHVSSDHASFIGKLRLSIVHYSALLGYKF